MNTIRIIHNRLLGGWYIVRGPHQTPLSGRFPSRQAARDHLQQQEINRATRVALGNSRNHEG